MSIGRGAVVHGCRVDDGCLIGMNATVLNRAAAGALVLEDTVIPPRSLVAGVPAKVRRQLTDDEVAGLALNADTYARRAQVYMSLG